jgi:hypothetical protein
VAGPLLLRAIARRLSERGRACAHTIDAVSSSDVDSARREWGEAYRRLEEESRDSGRAGGLRAQLAAMTDELRKRVGSTFTLGELAQEYRRADSWALQAVGGDELPAEWLATLAYVEGAAFHLYARGAVDYEP